MSDISYSDTAAGISAADLAGFFVGWPQPPSNEHRLRVVQAATAVVIARDPDNNVVGFITAVTDGVFAAYIPLLEVLPGHQGRGIGRALVQRMLARLRECYMIDLVCDDDVVPFYERLGGWRLNAVAWRNYDRIDRAPRA
jgi:ribosomal protein S18 acetylase RimI-like enzyme